MKLDDNRKINEVISEFAVSVPFDAVIFDCDGTLSKIEGIDELAAQKGVGAEVAAMTAVAMTKTGLNPELYQDRLNLVKPDLHQIEQLGKLYFENCTKDVEAVINVFKQLRKPVYIISAGVNPAVRLFGEYLGISSDKIQAVDLFFDLNGNYESFDKSSPLIRKQGKRTVINQIKESFPHLIYIGDGLNDLEASDLVTRFVGYGGNYYRANIEAHCSYYLKQESLTGLLPLSLTLNEYQQLAEAERQLYHQGLEVLIPAKQK